MTYRKLRPETVGMLHWYGFHKRANVECPEVSFARKRYNEHDRYYMIIQ